MQNGFAVLLLFFATSLFGQSNQQRLDQLEFLSSGMTHTIDRRVWWYLGRKYSTTYYGKNYGLIDIEWENYTPVITLAIRTTDHRNVNKQI